MSLSRAPVGPEGRAEARRALIAMRERIAPEVRARADAAIVDTLFALLSRLAAPPAQRVLGAYWPIRGEPDVMGLLARWRAAGGTTSLPVVVRRGAPLRFDRWSPGDPVRAGAHGTTEPASGVALRPDVVIVPCVGFSAAGLRLGYGGGYYDRTLADSPVPAIGVAYDACELPGLLAQPHDAALAFIVTERRLIDCAVPGGVRASRDD